MIRWIFNLTASSSGCFIMPSIDIVGHGSVGGWYCWRCWRLELIHYSKKLHKSTWNYFWNWERREEKLRNWNNLIFALITLQFWVCCPLCLASENTKHFSCLNHLSDDAFLTVAWSNKHRLARGVSKRKTPKRSRVMQNAAREPERKMRNCHWRFVSFRATRNNWIIICMTSWRRLITTHCYRVINSHGKVAAVIPTECVFSYCSVRAQLSNESGG